MARGWLGVIISQLDDDMAEALGLDEPKGALVNQVTEDSPADDAGIKDGDVILRVNGKKIDDSSELVNIIANFPPGKKVEVMVWRDGKKKNIKVELGERPGSESLRKEAAEKLENILGLEVGELTPENMSKFKVDYEGQNGVLVVNVKRGSAAAKEGIRPGDLVVSVNRKPVESVSDFNDLMDELQPNKVVLFRMKRGRTSYFAAIRVPKNGE